MNTIRLIERKSAAMMTGIRVVRPNALLARAAAILVAATSAFSAFADDAPREALPSAEAIEWLLETEETGIAVPWQNSQSGYSGTVMITQTWYRWDGAPCRRYRIAAIAGGPRTTITGVGCRVGTAAWELTENEPAAMAAAPPAAPRRKPDASDKAPQDDPPAPPPATAAAQPSPEPVVEPPHAPLTADETAVSTPALFTPPTVEDEPLAIAASLPSRSEE